MPTLDKNKVNKTDNNFVIVNFKLSYDASLILPFKEGLALVGALEKAELIKKSYNTPATITDLTSDGLDISFIGAQEYGESKLRSLINGEDSST
jgi:hypothetical protein